MENMNFTLMERFVVLKKTGKATMEYDAFVKMPTEEKAAYINAVEQEIFNSEIVDELSTSDGIVLKVDAAPYFAPLQGMHIAGVTIDEGSLVYDEASEILPTIGSMCCRLRPAEVTKDDFRLPKKLEVGRNCWYKGVIYEIAREVDSSRWLLLNSGEGFTMGVPKYTCYPVADEVFLVGDKVASAYSFTGTVTGYEEETNRVICISDKIANYSDDRTRYSYSVNELTNDTYNKQLAIAKQEEEQEKAEKRRKQMFYFELGKHYKINSELEVMATAATKEDNVNLIGVYEAYLQCVPVGATRDQYRYNHKIFNIQEMK